MKIVVVVVLTFLLLPSLVAQATGIRREINQLIRYETNIDYNETPGFIVGMIDVDTSYILSFGKRAQEDERPLYKDDVFELGGTTKVFTALLIELIKDSFDIDVNQSINNYLPVASPSFASCTPAKLMTHTAGIPKYPPGWGIKEVDSQDPYGYFNKSDLKDFFLTYDLKGQSEGTYLYSHLNYALLEWMLEHKTGKTYAELLTRYMDRFFKVSLTEIPTVKGYNYSMREVKPWSANIFGSSLGLRANISQVMNAAYYFMYSRVPAFDALFQPQDVIINNGPGLISKGWQVLPVPKNRLMYFHAGRTEGHHTFIGILPATKTAVVIMANSAKGTDLLGLSILRMMNKNWKRKN